MDDILDSLAQDIEQASFSRFFAKSEYRRNQQSAMEHTQWLEEHLDDEGRAHLDQAHAAEVIMDTLERQAMVRMAIALGIHRALAH